MKRIISLLCAILMLFSLIVSVSADSDEIRQQLTSSRDTLFIVVILLILLAIACVIFIIMDISRCRSNYVANRLSIITICCLVTLIVTIICCVFCVLSFHNAQQAEYEYFDSIESSHKEEPSTQAPTTIPEEPDEPIVEPEPEPEPKPTQKLSPVRTEASDPANWDVDWDLLVGSQVVDSFQREETINFGTAEEYYRFPGISTFRGNNYRTTATYGTTNITEEQLEAIWNKSVGGLDGWPGVGWTGQPLVVQWDESTKSIMNLYENKKQKTDLVEVICTTLDGYVYFLDLEDGSYTRDPMWIGACIKGTACLDPRGYPLMFAGSGNVNPGQTGCMYGISLIDTTIIWKQSGSDGMNYRGWSGFDGCAIISGEADTLLWGGENGLLYTIKLNTQYDPDAGTLTMDPENVLRTRYSYQYSYQRYVGYESSIVTVGQYAFIGDNGGLLFCVDLMTMELIWAQFLGDDINATPVFEWADDGNAYLYTATSADYEGGICRMHKINANTGEIVWEFVYEDVVVVKDQTRGVLSSPVLGQPGTDLEGMIIHFIGGKPDFYSGILFALDTETGKPIYEINMDTYAWSSIASLYTPEGKGYLALPTASGHVYLIDGATGKTLAKENLHSNMEASPVVFENTLVVGTRGQQIYGVKIK